MPIKVTALRIVLPLLMLALSACATTSSKEAWLSRDGLTYEQWVKLDLEPYLKDTLSTHPRFKGESLLIVSMSDDQRKPRTDRLSRQLIDRLKETLLDTGGVVIVRESPSRTAQCEPRTPANYHIGVDITAIDRNEHRVSVRALDIEDGRWVSGFGRQWQGKLNKTERRAFTDLREQRDEFGSRDRPFTASQIDLLAEQLAASLDRHYCGRVGVSPRIVPVFEGNESELVAKTVSLVSHYLNQSHHLTVVVEPELANVELRGKLVSINEELHQLWVVLRPLDAADERQAVDVQSYIRVPAHLARRNVDSSERIERAERAERTERLPQRARRSDRLLSSVRVVTPKQRRRCQSDDPWRRGWRFASGGDPVYVETCFALEILARQDAYVFLFALDQRDRLVRLAPSTCSRFGRVDRMVKSGAKLRYPSPANGREHVFADVSGADFEEFFVVAVSNRSQAEAIFDDVRRIGDACDRGPRSQVSNRELSEIDELFGRLGPGAEWHRVRVERDGADDLSKI